MIFDDLQGAHEKRFEKMEANLDLSKYTNQPVPDFKRYAIRDLIKDLQSNKNPRGKRPQPDYYPNAEYTMKSLGVGLAAFDKVSGRDWSNARNRNDNTPSMFQYFDNA